MLNPRYRNYWLDLARKEMEDKEKEKKKTISNILLGLLMAKKKKK